MPSCWQSAPIMMSLAGLGRPAERLENFNGMRQELFAYERKLSPRRPRSRQAGSCKLFQFVQRLEVQAD